MDELSVIHDELDIKILILFVLNKLNAPTDRDTLMELCLIDDGISYFDFIQCLDDLANTEQLNAGDGKYSITPEGSRNVSLVESELPLSIRRRAEQSSLKLTAHLQRQKMIGAKYKKNNDGSFSLELSLSDGKGEIMFLRLLCPDEKRAKIMKDKYTSDPEGFYSHVMDPFL